MATFGNFSEKRALWRRILVPRFFSWQNKRAKILVCALILLGLIAIGYAGYHYFLKPKAVDTVTFDGQEFKVNLLTVPSADTRPVAGVSIADQIKQQEEKIRFGKPTYTDYLEMAQLYIAGGNKAKAIEYYQRAKEVAPSTMPYYESTIKSLDETIKALQEQQQ